MAFSHTTTMGPCGWAGAGGSKFKLFPEASMVTHEAAESPQMM